MSISLKLAQKIPQIQKQLHELKLDGWLLYDFQKTNPLAIAFLEIPNETHLTRRFFYWIPKTGNPILLVHAIESATFPPLPGNKKTYFKWQTLESELKHILGSARVVAMEYFPKCAIPSLSKVDAGTIELVRDCGVKVVSSAELLQAQLSVWNEEKWNFHLEAIHFLDQTVELVLEKMAKALKSGERLTEYEIQQWMTKRFSEGNFVSEGLPICAFREHSADPHFSPQEKGSYFLEKGNFILLDLWCKKNVSGAVYADITWVAFAGHRASDKQREVFQIVKKARDTTFNFIHDRIQKKETVRGYEADQVCRNVIEEAGYGDYFSHRTGHNIDIQDHGFGTHLDSLETRDERPLIPSTCFSIEPGIYLPGEFGIRLEYDIFIAPNRVVQVTGKVQNEIMNLF